MISEWCTFLIRNADIAYVHEAYIASILTSASGIETHLRYEFSYQGEQLTFYKLIELSPIPKSLKTDLHKLRRYRNKWVHVKDPCDDDVLLEKPSCVENELENMALFALKALRKTVYLNPFI